MKIVKKLLLGVLLVLTSISLGKYLEALHHNRFEYLYERCKVNSDTQEQVFRCVAEDPIMKILGTILFSEGSVLE